jgi:hypothetical protein
MAVTPKRTLVYIGERPSYVRMYVTYTHTSHPDSSPTPGHFTHINIVNHFGIQVAVLLRVLKPPHGGLGSETAAI